jgi:hypothetical protein
MGHGNEIVFTRALVRYGPHGPSIVPAEYLTGDRSQFRISRVESSDGQLARALRTTGAAIVSGKGRWDEGSAHFVITKFCEAADPSAESKGGLRDDGTLCRRFEADVSTMNPVLATSGYDRLVASYLFTPLIRFDRELRPIPGLATSWQIFEDGKLYRFISIHARRSPTEWG